MVFVFPHQIFLIEARRRRDLGYHLLFIVQLFHTSSVSFIKKGRQTLHPTPIILKTAVFCWLSAAMPGRASIVAGTYRPRRGPTLSPRCGRDVRWDILCRGNYPAHAQYSFACRRTEPSGSLTVYTKPDGLSTKTVQLCCGWSRNTISPVALSMDSTIARLSSWMPLLRMRSPPCWKPFSTAMPMPSTVAPAFSVSSSRPSRAQPLARKSSMMRTWSSGVRNFLETMTL